MISSGLCGLFEGHRLAPVAYAGTFFPLPSMADDIDEDKCALVLDGLVDPVVDDGEPEASTVATAMLRNELEELKLKVQNERVDFNNFLLT